MKKIDEQIARLISIRNSYGTKAAIEKLKLLHDIEINKLKNKRLAEECYSTLLFIIAYPDNKTIYRLANQLFQALQVHILSDRNLQYQLYNTGITGTKLCAGFSFELVKWMRKMRSNDIKLVGFEADDALIQSILSVVMSKTESEILQDANAEWKGWLKQQKKKNEDLLDQFIDIFDSSDIRPELKEECWNMIGLNIEILFTTHCQLPESLTKCYYHRSLVRKKIKQTGPIKPVAVRLSETEAAQIVDCSRMILVRKLRELDPISFTSAKHVSLYHLPRGISIALTGMVPKHRHPVDSYMGYLVFKNNLPVAYAGSWILFNSARIGLNVFADYRGGEARYIFDQILQLHARVYNLKRFTVDPYQIGKENSEGIKSGAFWTYYRAGFRPLQAEQRELAAAEAAKIKADHKYRSSSAILKKLADSRLELILKKKAVSFDATDLSLAYAAILAKKYKGNRSGVENAAAKRLANILQIKNFREPAMNYVLKNWGLILLINEKELRRAAILKNAFKKLFLLKSNGSEEAYIAALQKSNEIRSFIERIIEEFTKPEK